MPFMCSKVDSSEDTDRGQRDTGKSTLEAMEGVKVDEGTGHTVREFYLASSMPSMPSKVNSSETRIADSATPGQLDSVT